MCIRWLAALLLLLFGFISSAHGETYMQDEMGRAAPPTNFRGSGGQQTQVNATDRLPVQTANEAAGIPTGPGTPPTTSTTDPMGWGMQWATGSYAAAAANVRIMPVAVSLNLYYGFAIAEAAQTVDLYTSYTQGRTWERKQTLNFGVAWTAIHFAYQISAGWWLIGGNCGAAVTPGCTGLGVFNVSGAAAQVALTGLAAGIAGGMTSIHQQGTTVVGTWVRGADSTARRCRSTDSGITWACDAASFGTLPIGNGKGVDSPAINTWIRGVTGGIQRSTDDGVTFASVLSGLVGDTLDVVECISSTVCLFTNGQDRIYRSTDAGLTWTLTFTTPGGMNPLYSGFVDYTNGVVAAVPSAITMDIWLSRDSGATWTPTYRLAGNTQRCTNPCQASAIQGAGVWSGGQAVNAEKVVYSPALGAGQTQIVGATGIALAIDSSGRVTANQGAGGGISNNWAVYLTDGTVNRLVNPNTLAVSPVQGTTLFNTHATSAANTAISATIGAAASTRGHIYFTRAICSAGTAQLTIADGASTVYQSTAAEVGATPFYLPMSVASIGLTGNTNSALVVTLGACGAGNTGTLTVWGDRF